MAYTPTVYVNDNPPALNANSLNKSEQGIAEAHAAIALAEDEIDVINNQIAKSSTKFDDSLFETGNISSNTGANSTGYARIRSIGYIKNVYKITGNPTHGIALFAYRNGTYIGWWNGSEFVKSADYTLVEELEVPSADYDYRFVFRKEQSETSVQGLANISVRYYMKADDLYSLQTKVDELSVIDGLVFNSNLFEGGGYSPIDGSSIENDLRIRSKNYVDCEEVIASDNNHEIAMFAWDDEDNYIGFWDGTNYVKTTNPVYFRDVTIDKNYNCKIVIKKITYTEPIETVLSNISYIGSIKIAIKDNTDKINTLKQTDVSLQAEIDEISVIDNLIFNSNLFEEGGYSPADGSKMVAYLRIRSKDYVDCKEVRAKDNVHKVAMLAWDDEDNYVGYWNGTSFVKTGSVEYFENIVIDKNYNCKIVISKSVTSEPIETVLTYVRYNGFIETEIKNIIDETFNIEDEISDINNELAEIKPYSQIYMCSDMANTPATFTDLIALYDDMVSIHPDIVTKTSLVSGNFTNYEYLFSVGNYNISGQRTRDSIIAKPEILIITGVHGDEKSSDMAVYQMFKDMVDGKADILTAMLEKCDFRVIPCVTPSAYNSNTRWNENGVNINRNFDAGWQSSQSEAFTADYPGPSAASEDETKVVQNWLQAHVTALCMIDYHNSGYNNEMSYLSGSNETNPSKIKWGYRNGIADIVNYWMNEREITASNTIYEYTGYLNIGGSSERYGNSQEIDSFTFESSINVNNSGKNSKLSSSVGAEGFSRLLYGIIKNIIEAGEII